MIQDVSSNVTEVFRYTHSNHAGRYITILNGKDRLKQIDLYHTGKQEIVFGRDTTNSNLDIILDSSIVSHIHGRFIFEKGKWYIEDLESANGILFNGAYITRHLLSDGDILRIGSLKEEREDAVLFLVSSDISDSGWTIIPLSSDIFTIGRDENNDLVLPYTTVSRKHATLYKEKGRWFIENESVGNGVLVNDLFVYNQYILREHDVISITTTKIIFTSTSIYVCTNNHGISVNASNIVVVRGKGKKSFITSDHVDMNISPGELVAIIGGSGAGKSTIMNVLCGYLKPNEGSVRINGNDLYENFDVLKNCFGYVPQADIVYNNLTLYDMLKYTAELRLPKDLSKDEIDRAIFHAIKLVELDEKKDSLIRDLSGGQRKRASIAVELLSDPKLIFLDEPASGLDPGTERSLMQSLKRMTETGKTIILVTHSTLQLSLCDKIAFMGRGGKLCFFGNEAEALAFFETDDIVDVYSKITEHSGEWQKKYNETILHSDAQEININYTDKQKKQKIHQLSVLCKRYIKLTVNDKQRLVILILQAPILAALISCVANGEQFKQYEMTKSLLFALSCSGFWIGMLNAIQEICKEKTILKREYMTGISLTSYIQSKILILGLLCFIQSILLTAVFYLLIGIPEHGILFPPLLELFITTWLTAVSASSMGLFVSSLFTNPDRAMTVAPLLLMPQMLFSGLLFTLSGATEYISWFAICRWSMEGFGTTANLNALPLALQQQGIAIVHESEAFFEYTQEHILIAWLILVAFTALFLVLSRIVLSKIRKAVN